MVGKLKNNLKIALLADGLADWMNITTFSCENTTQTKKTQQNGIFSPFIGIPQKVMKSENYWSIILFYSQDNLRNSLRIFIILNFVLVFLWIFIEIHTFFVGNFEVFHYWFNQNSLLSIHREIYRNDHSYLSSMFWINFGYRIWWIRKTIKNRLFYLYSTEYSSYSYETIEKTEILFSLHVQNE